MSKLWTTTIQELFHQHVLNVDHVLQKVLNSQLYNFGNIDYPSAVYKYLTF